MRCNMRRDTTLLAKPSPLTARTVEPIWLCICCLRRYPRAIKVNASRVALRGIFDSWLENDVSASSA